MINFIEGFFDDADTAFIFEGLIVSFEIRSEKSGKMVVGVYTDIVRNLSRYLVVITITYNFFYLNLSIFF